MPVDANAAKAIFMSALEKSEPAERAVYVSEACGHDDELRQRVEILLKAHEDPGSFMKSPIAGSAAVEVATVDRPVTEEPGTVIGPYKLMEQIGEGGFGLVFIADQQRPVRRRVALKVIKPGMDTRAVIARFEAERQALALMDHPNIAKVLDGGETASGRPYFVMELVKGVPITEYSDDNRLTPRERLELFLHVCQAVQHAHQKGIIHRDIKPSNALVVSHDGTPVVKVIDFGVAKAIGQQLTDKTLYTQSAQLVGTPLYMSPEQAGQSGLDIDTRTDIYALGVLLYELLTGTTPFAKERFQEAGYDEIRRILREEEPPKPSTRISTLGRSGLPSRTSPAPDPARQAGPTAQAHTTDVSTIAAQRKTDPKRLSQLFRGELDWIVMKALEKDRDRRYETASTFAADVQRYLHDEPVQACPPSAWYRMRKFGRRNRVGLVTALSLSVAVLVAVGGISWAVRDRSAVAEQVAHDNAARRAALEGRISQALDDTQAAYERDHLPEALTAIKRAEGLLASDPGVRHEIRQSVDQWRAELTILQRLEALPFPVGSPDPWREKDAAYSQVFRDIGINIDEMPVQEAGRRIRSCLTWKRLAEALDAWAGVRHDLACREGPNNFPGRWPENVFFQKRRLFQVARAADSDKLRTKARLAAENWDLKAAEQLAASPEINRLPASTLHGLAMVIYWWGDESRRESAVRLLMNAQLQRPGDFELNIVLASYFSQMEPPRWIEAAHYSSIAVALRPESGSARGLLALALKGQGKVDHAIAQQREAIRLRSDFPEAHNPIGPYTTKADLMKVKADLIKAVKTKPDDPAVWFERGCFYGEVAEWTMAAGDFAKLVQLAPDDHYLWLRHACLRLQIGDSNGYIEACQEMLNRFSDTTSPSAAHRVALACLLTPQICGDPSLVLQLAERGVEGAPQDLWHVVTLAAAHLRMGKQNESARMLSEALQSANDHRKCPKMMAQLLLAMAHYSQGRRYEAGLLLKTAIAGMDMKFPLPAPDYSAGDWIGWIICHVIRREVESLLQNPDAEAKPWIEPARLGRSYLEKREWDEAIVSFTKAIQSGADNPEIWLNRADAYAEQQQWDQAAPDFAKAIEMGANEFRCSCEHALVRLAMGDKEGYRRACADLLARFSQTDDPVAACYVAWVCALSKDSQIAPAQVLPLAERGCAEVPSYLNLTGRSIIRYRAGRLQEAVESATEAMNAHPKRGTAFDFFLLAMTHERLGHTDEARRWLDKGIAWYEAADEQKLNDSWVRVPLLWTQRLELQFLRREAEGLVKASATPAPGKERKAAPVPKQEISQPDKR